MLRSKVTSLWPSRRAGKSSLLPGHGSESGFVGESLDSSASLRMTVGFAQNDGKYNAIALGSD